MRSAIVAAMGLAIGVSSPGAVLAEDRLATMSGNYIHTACNSDDIGELSACAYYVIGILDGIKLIDTITNNNKLCIPGAVTNQQIVDVVRDYVRERPEIRHQSASTMVLASLLGQFPCSP